MLGCGETSQTKASCCRTEAAVLPTTFRPFPSDGRRPIEPAFKLCDGTPTRAYMKTQAILSNTQADVGFTVDDFHLIPH